MSKKINNEMRIYGENACLAVFKNRPEDIIQFFYTKNKTKDSPNIIRDITTYLAKNKKAYHMVTSDEIEKLTKATHHEDMSMLVKKKNEITLDNFIRQKNKEANPKSLILVLEDVSNPHNVGAILRTAAHFGVDALIISSKKVAETASSIRVSEGGSEFVNVFESNDIGLTLKLLVKEKYQIITTSSHAKKDVSSLKWKNKAVIVFGEEAHGLSKEILNAGETIKIPGTDFVESLNVSVASSILMYDFYQKVCL